jgi:acyl-CoA reductase-like NAD-dependent aldehyde dehydrogenase
MSPGIEQVLSWVGGAVVERDNTSDWLELVSPIDGGVAASIEESSDARVTLAVEDAHRAYLGYRKSTSAQRAKWLVGASAELLAVRDELVERLIEHVGKPRRMAQFEVGRSADFMRATANELSSMRGELLPVDAVEAGAGRIGMVRRIPYGVVAGITPFNAPINLLMQKIAPAIAAGNAVVVKPAPQGAAVAVLVAQAFQRAGLPDGLLNVVTGGKRPALALAAHRLVAAVTFTGGTAAGDALARAAGAKRFLAELGSNAANIVLSDANLDEAALRIASAAFEAGGQQCISAQRVIVEAPVFDAFVGRFVAATRALRVGNPREAGTDIGPLVHSAAADRVMAMVDDARKLGAHIALAPTRSGCLVSPAIVIDPPLDAAIMREEAFGPIVAVIRADNAEHALVLANDSQFGLQGAVFTSSLDMAFRFADDFDVGSLWINEASRFRLDMYPFGGVKQSGVGREGVRYAIEELSQMKFIGIRPR